MPIEVFISYSHHDEMEKNELLRHLSVLRLQGSFDLWSDDRIGIGQEWKPQIDRALARAQVAILLVTKNFLTSDFILGQEVPEILERHQQGLTIIPIIARDCAWRRVEWLARLQVFNNGLVVWRDDGKHVDKELSEVTYLIAEIAKTSTADQHANKQHLPAEPVSIAPPPSVAVTEAERPTVDTEVSAAPTLSAPPKHIHALFVSVVPPTEKGRLWEMPFRRKKRYAEHAEASAKLFDAVKAEFAERSHSGQLSLQSRTDGLLITTSGDAAPLLRFAIHALRAVKPIGETHLRIGLHSSEIDAAALNRRTGLPHAAVNTTRLVTRLGREKHLLASQPAAELLRRDAEFAPLFHSAGLRMVEPPESIEIYNVYRHSTPADEQTDFGNDASPLNEIPETVVRKFSAPRQLRSLKDEHVEVTFWPGQSYIKVKFEFEDSDGQPTRGLRVSCHKHAEQGCSFEYRFNDKDEEHKPQFTLYAVDPPADQTFFIKMSCYNEQGELITLPLFRRIRLLRKVPFPSPGSGVLQAALQVAPWVLDQFMRSPVVLRVLVLVLAIPTLAWTGNVWLCARSPERCTQLKCVCENLKRKYWYGYETYLSPPWYDEVRLNQPPGARWQFSGEQVRLQDGEGLDSTDGALVVSGGTGMVVSANLRSKAFYDFTVKFKVRFIKGYKAVWIFRANPEEQTGYMFELKKSSTGSKLELYGWRKDGAAPPVALDNSNPRVMDSLKNCCFPDDTFEIIARVQDYTISYTLKVEGDTRIPTPVGPYDMGTFTDEERRYRYGNNGFFMPPGDEMGVEYWRLDPIVSKCDVQ